MGRPFATDIVMNSISAVFVVLAVGFIAYMVAAILRSREADPAQRQHRNAWLVPVRPVKLRVPDLPSAQGTRYRRHPTLSR